MERYIFPAPEPGMKRSPLASPLFGFARTQTHPLALWTVTDEDRVRRSGLMTAAWAIQNGAHLLQQFEAVPLYAIGTARVIRRHRFPQTVRTNSGHDADRQTSCPHFTGVLLLRVKSTPKLEECKRPSQAILTPPSSNAPSRSEGPMRGSAALGSSYYLFSFSR